MAVARPLPVPLSGVEITRMKRRHLRRVLSIEGRVYPRPWSPSLFLSELSQKNTRSYIVARFQGDVVGYAGMMFTGFEAHITNIAVEPNLQGQKIGSRLLLTLITEAIANGSSLISLEVRVSNLAAQSMYTKFGFHIAGARKGYYIETREDALVMETSDILSNAYRLRLQGLRVELEDVTDAGS